MLRTLTLITLAAGTVFAQPARDLYGGRLDIPCLGGARAQFYTEKIGVKWWLCTPLGHGFFFQGVSNISVNSTPTDGGYNYQGIVSAKFAGDPNSWQNGWADNSLARIKAWGFNAVGDSSSDYVQAWGAQGAPRVPATKLPSIPANLSTFDSFQNRFNLITAGTQEKNLMDLVAGSAFSNFVGRGLADVFDPGYSSYLTAIWALTLGDPYFSQWLTSPYSLGVVVDESDDVYGMDGPGLGPPAAPDGIVSPHVGWIAIATPPRRYASAATISGASWNVAYADPTNFSKLELRKELDGTTYPLTGKYLTIGAQNAAWGSTYTTFGSSGTQITGESIGTGNGSTKVFSGTLAHGSVDHFSMGIKVAGTVVGGDFGDTTFNPQTTFAASAVFDYTYNGFLIYFITPPANGSTIAATYTYTDCGGGTATTTFTTGDGTTQSYNTFNLPPITWACGLGNSIHTVPGTVIIKVNGVAQGTDVSAHPTITGAGVGSSSINYTTGVYTLTFLTAPPNLAAITTDYHINGWCNGGTGLMDECGNNTAWLGPTDAVLNPAFASAGVVTDLNTYLFNFSKQYFSVQRTAFKASSPTQLMFCPELNNHAGLTRPQTLQAAGMYCDVLQAGATTQALLDGTAAAAGDVPLFQGFIGRAANPDSSLHAYANPGGDLLTTQAQKGAALFADVLGTINGAVTATGSKPNIGWTLWDWADAWCDGGSCAKVNWGLVTSRDNVYDGHEAVSALNIQCQPPQQAYTTCGGEDFNYGDLLTSIKVATALWLQSTTPGSTIGGKHAFQGKSVIH